MLFNLIGIYSQQEKLTDSWCRCSFAYTDE